MSQPDPMEAMRRMSAQMADPNMQLALARHQRVQAYLQLVMNGKLAFEAFDTPEDAARFVNELRGNREKVPEGVPQVNDGRWFVFYWKQG